MRVFEQMGMGILNTSAARTFLGIYDNTGPITAADFGLPEIEDVCLEENKAILAKYFESCRANNESLDFR